MSKPPDDAFRKDQAVTDDEKRLIEMSDEVRRTIVAALAPLVIGWARADSNVDPMALQNAICNGLMHELCHNMAMGAVASELTADQTWERITGTMKAQFEIDLEKCRADYEKFIAPDGEETRH